MTENSNDLKVFFFLIGVKQPLVQILVVVDKRINRVEYAKRRKFQKINK